MAEIEKLKPKPSELAAVLSKANLPLALPAPKLTPDAGIVFTNNFQLNFFQPNLSLPSKSDQK